MNNERVPNAQEARKAEKRVILRWCAAAERRQQQQQHHGEDDGDPQVRGEQVHGGDHMDDWVLLFKRRDSVMQSLTDVLGPTLAAFMQNAMNNCFWWAYAEHVQETMDYLNIGSWALRLGLMLAHAIVLTCL